MSGKNGNAEAVINKPFILKSAMSEYGMKIAKPVLHDV